jgi:NAD(P)H-hydrate epimerase
VKEVDLLLKLAPRKRDTHKGDYGHILVVGGSHGMAGAPCLCGEAALRSGAGLVTVAIPQGIYPIVATKLTCCMTLPLPQGPTGGIDDRDGEALIEYAMRFDVIALGPGIGRAPETSRFVRLFISRVARPMVVDADALNCLAEDTEVLRKLPRRAETASAGAAPRILTPHPGEMARLARLKSAGSVQHARRRVAATVAAKFGVVVVLKGYRTVVTDGKRIYVNATGNPGMATGGTGDVLTGLIAALMAQKLKPFEAAQLGVYVHGLAGDLAAERLGEISMIASDLLDELPNAFLKLQR